ncbi:MAG: DUF4230 domain-containing protein [Chloroflexota bacterium]
MDKSRSIFFILAILVILGFTALSVINVVQDTTDKALSPVTGLLTQAAQILNPTPTIIPDPNTIIHEVRAIARLETIQYSLEKIITAETNQGNFGFLFGDRLLFVAHGMVIAGIDLEKLVEGDLYVNGDVLFVRLPKAEIFIATLDNDKSYVYDRDTGFFAQNQVNLETAARQAAENEILKAAMEDGILEQAQTNAENYMFRLLRNLGYPDITFLEAK